MIGFPAPGWEKCTVSVVEWGSAAAFFTAVAGVVGVARSGPHMFEFEGRGVKGGGEWRNGFGSTKVHDASIFPKTAISDSYVSYPYRKLSERRILTPYVLHIRSVQIRISDHKCDYSQASWVFRNLWKFPDMEKGYIRSYI